MSAIVDLIKQHAVAAGLLAALTAGGAVYVVAGGAGANAVPDRFAYTIGTQHGTCDMTNTLSRVKECDFNVTHMVRDAFLNGRLTKQTDRIGIAIDPNDDTKVAIGIIGSVRPPMFVPWTILERGFVFDGLPFKVTS